MGAKKTNENNTTIESCNASLGAEGICEKADIFDNNQETLGDRLQNFISEAMDGFIPKSNTDLNNLNNQVPEENPTYNNS